MSVEKLDDIYRGSVIAILEKLLVDAREGEITEIVVMVSAGNDYYVKHSNSKDVVKLIGELELIKSFQIKRISEN